MCNVNFTRLTTEQVEISETKLNVYTLCTVKSRLLSSLVLPSCIEDFTQPPKLLSIFPVLPICSEGLLDLLTICLILSCLYPWVSLLLLLLIWLLFLFSWPVGHFPFRRYLPDFYWILLLPRSTCLVRRAVSSLLSVS